MKGVQPPEGITNFLEKVCPAHLFEGIIGDLTEQFYTDLQEKGEKKARRLYVWNATRFIRPGILLRNRLKLKIINTIMLANHLKVGTRSLLRNKLYSFINAFGLSIAIAFSVLIYLFVQDERSFDQFHKNKDRIYRVHKARTSPNRVQTDRAVSKSAYLQVGLAPVLKAELPEVSYATGFNPGQSAIFNLGDKTFNESITYVHQDFFRMFDFKAITGDFQEFLTGKSQIVLSESTALKYFGEHDPMGKDIELNINNQAKIFTVAGIIEDAPANSSLNYQAALIHAENRDNYQEGLDDWQSWGTPTFVMLESATQYAQFQSSLEHIYEKYVQTAIDAWVEETGYEPQGKSWYESLNLSEIHLYPEVNWTRVSDPKYGLILSGIAILILVIACINYIALAMTSAAGKSLEVGIRKVVGGARRQLFWQFIVESLLLSFFAMLLATVLLVLFLPYFNTYTVKSIHLQENFWQIALVMMTFSLCIGLLAGTYPSLVLAAFKPIAMLGSRKSSKVKASVTRPLVVLQFAISTFLVICSVVMFRQMNYITTKDLGYDQDQVLVIPTYTGRTDEGEQLLERFKVSLEKNPAILGISGTSSSFNQGWSRNGYRIDGKVYQAFNYRVDPGYIKTLGINVKIGRDFDHRITSDRKKTLLVNEALVADMGWEDPLNELLNWRNDSLGGWKIIGVIEDYHFRSLEQGIEPMFLHLDPDEGKITTLIVKISPTDIPKTIHDIENVWKTLAGGRPFDYTFLDEDVARQYESYQKWSNIMGLSTLFAIVIACLGLFGLAGINALNRTKEIGIRKALGAEIHDILLMMNKPFIIMATLSFAISVPVSWWAMQQWLSDFKFSITLGWPLFLISLLGALFFALLAVSYHALRSAFISPAETLKYE